MWLINLAWAKFYIQNKNRYSVDNGIKPTKMLYILFVIIAVSGLYFILPGITTAEETPQTFLTHTGLVIKTTGEVIDPIGYNGDALDFDPETFMKDFDYGEVSVLEDGTTLREFYITARDDQIMEVSPGVFYNVWTFNDSVPGPTIRATEGDLVRIHFTNEGSKPHSLHFHGIHKAEMDGVFESIGTGGKFTYEFYAEPVGLHLYHCHVHPVEEHIAHGLYGAYIVDPKEGRDSAEEFVFVLNGLDTDFDGENNFYAANTIPFYYQHHPIEISTNQKIRAYVVNVLEFDAVNNFHLHGTLFHHYPAGTNTIPSGYNDMLTMSQGDRQILEFSYKYPGLYMFHAHNTEFSEKGWVSTFLVKENTNNFDDQVEYDDIL